MSTTESMKKSSSSPASSSTTKKEDAGGSRTREQLLKLLESSAKKLKQFDRKYGIAKAQIDALQTSVQKKEADNAQLQSKVAALENEVSKKLKNIETIDSDVLNHVQSDAATEIQNRLQQELDSQISKENVIIQLLNSLQIQCKDPTCTPKIDAPAKDDITHCVTIVSQCISEVHKKVTALQNDLKAKKEEAESLQEKYEKIMDGENQATEELQMRVQNLTSLNAQVESLQSEVEVESERAELAESSLSQLLAEKTELEKTIMRLEEEQVTHNSNHENGENVQDEKDTLLQKSEDANKLLRSTLEDTKKKFAVTAKKKQTEFAAKVKGMQDTIAALEAQIKALEEGKVEQSTTQIDDLSKKLQEKDMAYAQVMKNLETTQSQLDENRGELSKLQEIREEQDNRMKELTASHETDQKEVKRLKDEVDTLSSQKSAKRDVQQDKLKAAAVELKKKLERSEKTRLKVEQELSSTRSSLAAQKAKVKEMAEKNEEISESQQAKIGKVEGELKSYKARAHLLLQQKDEQLKRTVSIETSNKLKDKILSLESEIGSMIDSRRDLEQALAALEHQSTKERAFLQENCTKEVMLKEQEALGKVNEWKSKAENLHGTIVDLRRLLEEEKAKVSTLEESVSVLEKDYNHEKEGAREWREKYNSIQEEYKMFKQTSEDIVQAKDREISELVFSNKNKTLDSMAPASQDFTVSNIKDSIAIQDTVPSPEKKTSISEPYSLETELFGDSSSNNFIIEAARMQASRDEVLEEYLQRMSELEGEVEEYQKEISMREQLELVLKEELRKKEREENRSNMQSNQVDMEYLKNIILKLLETGEHEALLPVIATLLSLSPDEVGRIKKAYANMPVNPNSQQAMEYAAQAATDVTSYITGLVWKPK